MQDVAGGEKKYNRKDHEIDQIIIMYVEYLEEEDDKNAAIQKRENDCITKKRIESLEIKKNEDYYADKKSDNKMVEKDRKKIAD